LINLQNAVFSKLSALLKFLAPADKQDFYHFINPFKMLCLRRFIKASGVTIFIQKNVANGKSLQLVQYKKA
jgi:hypothetical protein